MVKRLRLAVPLIATAVLTVVGGTATAASAATTTITTNTDFAECGTGNRWSFQITGVGGDTGIAAPAAILAGVAGGTSVTIPRAQVTAGVATYDLTTTAKLTGTATAQIDDAWDRERNSFGPQIGPCVPTKITIAAAAPVVVKGGPVTVAGQLTNASGAPLAGRDVRIRLHSVDAKGKGKMYGPVRTDANGRYTLPAVAESFGALRYNAEYNDSSPLERGEVGSESHTVVWSVPAGPPPAAGRLASTAGPAFSAGQRRTTVSGTGFRPNTDVGILLYSTPQVLGSTTSDAGGAFRLEVSVPAGVSGQHTLVAVGEAEAGIRYLSLPVTVAAGSASGSGGPATTPGAPGAPAPGAGAAADAAALPVTGAPVWVSAAGGLVLLLAGAAIWWLNRRRRIRFTAS